MRLHVRTSVLNRVEYILVSRILLRQGVQDVNAKHKDVRLDRILRILSASAADCARCHTVKWRCKVCSPHLYCEHGRKKKECTKCGGSSVCIHKRLKRQCLECGGVSMCVHNRRKAQCVECEGPGVCMHKRTRTQCIECGGASVCMHKRLKANCVECGGSAVCIHKRMKQNCIECKGSSVCEHGRQRSKCNECPECSIHLCPYRAAKSTDKTEAYKWEMIQQPTTGNEIYNDLLASALLQKLEFNSGELEKFQEDFFYDSYIKVCEKYYKPVGLCVSCARGERRSRFKGNERIVHYSLKRQGITLTAVSRTAARKKKEKRILDVLDTNDISQVNDKRAKNRDSECDR